MRSRYLTKTEMKTEKDEKLQPSEKTQILSILRVRFYNCEIGPLLIIHILT